MKFPGALLLIGLMAMFITLAAVTFAESGAPAAIFTSDVSTGTVPLTVQFYDNSTGNITGRLWVFGDNSTNATEPNPAHMFIAAGTFNVTLTVYNGSESNSVTHAIIVSALPTATPTATPTPTPTKKPNSTITPTPTKKPNSTITPTPTRKPTPTPTPRPTVAPTEPPTPVPTVEPTATPRPTPVPLPSQIPPQQDLFGGDHIPGIVAFAGFNLFVVGIAGCAYFLFFKK
jgi:PKD repeat protein